MVLYLPVIWLLITLSSLLSNRKLARQSNVLIFTIPGCSIDPIWIAFRKPLGPLLKALPFGLGFLWSCHNAGL